MKLPPTSKRSSTAPTVKAPSPQVASARRRTTQELPSRCPRRPIAARGRRPSPASSPSCAFRASGPGRSRRGCRHCRRWQGSPAPGPAASSSANPPPATRARRRWRDSRRRCSRRSTPPPHRCGSPPLRSQSPMNPAHQVVVAGATRVAGGATVELRERSRRRAGAGRRVGVHDDTDESARARGVVPERRRERIVDDVDVGAVRRDRRGGVDAAVTRRLDGPGHRPALPAVGRLGEQDALGWPSSVPLT